MSEREDCQAPADCIAQLTAERDAAQAAFLMLREAVVADSNDWLDREGWSERWQRVAEALAAAPATLAGRARARALREAAIAISWTGAAFHPDNAWMDGRYQQTIAIQQQLRALADEAESKP